VGHHLAGVRHCGELLELDTKTGSRPGDKYVRVVQPFSDSFRRQAPGHLVVSERVLRPSGAAGAISDLLRRILIGRRLATAGEIHERIGPIKGLAVFASDNISSSAYASEEIMRVVVAAGVGALALTMPLTIAIVVVLGIVVTSYQQTIRAYPNGGGSYIVASDNLGRIPGLIAAAALLTDYVLTVAVSIAAGVAALTSIYPSLFDWKVLVGITFVALLWLGNLRGIRESANIFAIPTYVYLVAIYAFLRRRPWIRVPALLWAATMLTNVSIILGEEAFGEHRTPQLAMVVLANAAWVAFPLLVLYRMAREEPFAAPR